MYTHLDINSNTYMCIYFSMALNGPAYHGLLRERDVSIASIRQVCNDAFRHGDNWSLTQLDSRMDLLAGYWQRFQESQRQLVMQYSDVEIIHDSIGPVELETAELFAEAKAEMRRLRNETQAAVPPPVKIPRVSDIKLSVFSGKYTEWASWRAEFQAKVCCA